MLTKFCDVLAQALVAQTNDTIFFIEAMDNPKAQRLTNSKKFYVLSNDFFSRMTFGHSPISYKWILHKKCNAMGP
jgi:hypothetical protein